MPDFMKILQQAQEMQGRLAKIQEELEAVTVTGTAGGGLVSVDANGKGEILRVKIDRTVVNPDDVEMLEDLVSVAVKEAQKKAQAEQQSRTQDEMGKLAGGLPFKLPF